MRICKARKPKMRELISAQWFDVHGIEPTPDHWEFAARYCAILSTVAKSSGDAIAECNVAGAEATIRGHKKYWHTVSAGLRWAAAVAGQIKGRTNGTA